MEDNNLYNSKDSMEINELASLNDDISTDFIDELQQKLTQDADAMSSKDSEQEDFSSGVNFNVNDDATLFEEPDTEEKSAAEEKKNKVQKKNYDIEKNFDDNFIKKYKAKLNKQNVSDTKDDKKEKPQIKTDAFPVSDDFQQIDPSNINANNIEKISNGTISEKAITKEQKEYNDSLDFLDGNVKYSKYVIYIDPQNVDFIDSLTVKERKNLINSILREQDDIAITKHRFKVANTIIKHLVVAILTITISIPVIYWTINTSLEATINNYRQSQSVFQALYKKNGKITQQQLYK